MLGFHIPLTGDGPEGEKHLLRAMKGKLNALGERDPSSIYTMHHLGLHFFNYQKYQEAEKYAPRAVELAEETLGPEAQQTHDARYGLAALLYGTGRIAEARELTFEMLKQVKKLRGENDVWIPNHMIDIGYWYDWWWDQNYTRAVSTLKSALKISRPLVGFGHPTEPLLAVLGIVKMH